MPVLRGGVFETGVLLCKLGHAPIFTAIDREVLLVTFNTVFFESLFVHFPCVATQSKS